MLRILEVIGLIAPLIGVVLLVLYRKRSRPAFAWGMAGSVLGILASLIGLLGKRLSIASAYLADEGLASVLEQMETWATLRFCLLVAAGALLSVAAMVDREGKRPTAWLVGGLALMAVSAVIHFIGVDLGVEHQRLQTILTILVEVAEVGLLGAGLLLLTVAVVAYRPGDDGRTDPADLAQRAGSAAWRLYTANRGIRG